MTELPKIGEKCQYYSYEDRAYYNGECVAHHADKAIILDDEDNTYTGCFAVNLRPIETEAEKQRVKQIDLMQKLVVDRSHGVLSLGGVASRRIATGLHMEGCRMTRELTQDVITELYRKHLVTIVAGSGYDFARSIENIILGEN